MSEPRGPGARPSVSRLDDAELLSEARRVLRVESAAVARLADRVGDEFPRAVRLIRNARGRVIVSGIGKSGIVGRKIAATLTSTGTPATFLHPVDGLHGDLGIVGSDDVAILISKSGNTEELRGLTDYLSRLGVPILALCGRTDSELSRSAAVTLDCSVPEEACPMDLAPTSSTTATMAVGDALAVALLKDRGFEPGDFARFHPGGVLGRALTVRVEDVMVAGRVPSLGVDATMKDCIVPLAEHRGTVPVLDAGGVVVGVVTAGDLTRLMEREGDFLPVSVQRVMTKEPRLAFVGERGATAVRRMQSYGIMALPVVDEEGRLEGIVHLHDLMRAGVV